MLFIFNMVESNLQLIIVGQINGLKAYSVTWHFKK